MPNPIWNRDPERAYSNPYDYAVQAHFIGEAQALLKSLTAGYDEYLMKFHRDELSLKKAVWMLHRDALDALTDCVSLISEKRHRLAGRLFRDAVETMDLAAYFSSNSAEAQTNLAKWYANEIIQHRIYRDFIKKTEGQDAHDERRRVYIELSRFTHRTYRALLKSYSIGRSDMMVYDGCRPSGHLILPHTIAAYLAIAGNLVLQFCDEAVSRGMLEQTTLDGAKSAAFVTLPPDVYRTVRITG
jgi:hypothetical protein